MFSLVDTPWLQKFSIILTPLQMNLLNYQCSSEYNSPFKTFLMYKNTQEVKLGEYRQPLAKQLMLYQIQNDITFICIFVFCSLTYVLVAV